MKSLVRESDHQSHKEAISSLCIYQVSIYNNNMKHFFSFLSSIDQKFIAKYYFRYYSLPGWHLQIPLVHDKVEQGYFRMNNIRLQFQGQEP